MSIAVSLAGCSFTTAAISGQTSVHERDELVDIALTTVASGGCIVAGLAAENPDSFAPVQNDPTSWHTPQDRLDTIAEGQSWAPLACTLAAAFLASGIYGHVVKVDPGATWSPGIGAGLAGFAAGFAAARTPPPVPEVESEPGCSNDFACGAGFRCVKNQYAGTGTCMRTVDEVGAPTFEEPSLDSVGPKQPSALDCRGDTDCGPGFRCDATAGVCVR